MRIAIPKGRLQERALNVFAAAGFDVPADADLKTRKLVFRTGDVGVRGSAPGGLDTRGNVPGAAEVLATWKRPLLSKSLDGESLARNTGFPRRQSARALQRLAASPHPTCARTPTRLRRDRRYK